MEYLARAAEATGIVSRSVTYFMQHILTHTHSLGLAGTHSCIHIVIFPVLQSAYVIWDIVCCGGVWLAHT